MQPNRKQIKGSHNIPRVSFCSAMMRKKAEDIEGVSGASFVDLKAVLYKREQDLKRYVPGDQNFTKRVKKRRRTKEQEENLFPDAKRNKGVEDRIQRDQRLWEAEAEPTSEQREAAMKEKAQKYREMQNRPHYDDIDPCGNSESLVDFERKRWDEDANGKPVEEEDSLENLHFLAKYTKEDEPEGIQYSRDALEKYTPGGYEYEVARESRVAAILQLSQETSENRQKKANIKQKREEEKQRRLRLIKQKAEQKKQTQLNTEAQ